MTYKLAAEDFRNSYGLVQVDDDNIYDVDFYQFNFPNEFIKKIENWYSSYYKYTGMNKEELIEHHQEIGDLDYKGVEILFEISKLIETKKNDVNSFVYYSRGTDKKLIEIIKYY